MSELTSYVPGPGASLSNSLKRSDFVTIDPPGTSDPLYSYSPGPEETNNAVRNRLGKSDET